MSKGSGEQMQLIHGVFKVIWSSFHRHALGNAQNGHSEKRWLFSLFPIIVPMNPSNPLSCSGLFYIELLDHAYMMCIARIQCIELLPSFRCLPPSIDRDPEVDPAFYDNLNSVSDEQIGRASCRERVLRLV